ncbi:hypothetical protein [Spiroplasma sp. AdecLV25b]|uniref:OTU domain-containing protein n=1 Tax=Spiroplasma sp. AdecLV25b TaxID=3027162 RepID=UPI0027DED3BE|nr:hypothetical protein [Spiroplasma sp. AdecLV25b]
MSLVKLFRSRICNYIKENLDTKRPPNKGDFKSLLLDSKINKKINPKDNEEKQLETTLKEMRKNGNYAGSVEIEAICNILNCNIIRSNEASDVEYIENFKPDYGKTNDEIKLHYYGNEHYKYSSNVINNRSEENISSATNQNYNALDYNNATSQFKNFYKQQLLSKDIDEENCNAIINIFIEDLNKSPSSKQLEILQKSIFELDNQDKLLENPNLSFESNVKPIINNPKTSAQELSAFANANINQPFAIKVT